MKSEKKTDLELAIIGAVEEDRAKLGPPPGDERLLAYHRGELSEEESADMQDLLAHYPDSVRRLADLTGLQSEPGDPDYLSDEELERDWERLQEMLSGQRAETGNEAAASVVSLPREESAADLASRIATLARRVSTWRIAAGLASLAFLGTLFYFQLELGGPRLKPEVLVSRVLLPDGDRRGAGDALAIRVPSPAGSGVLLLPSLSGKPRYPSYRLEIRRAEAGRDEILWSQSGIQLNNDDSFHLLVPTGYFPPGRHLLRLYGVRDGASQPVADYTVDF